MSLRRVDEVAAWRLCVGCGACAYACPSGCISLVDVVAEGIRPLIDIARCNGCAACIDACPGVRMTGRPGGGIAELAGRWGPVLELWEGYAADDEIRFCGSSGGVSTAISLYCIEKAGMSGALHVAADPGRPLANKTVLSRSRADLLPRTGSRYAPASPCDGLGLIENAGDRCVFIGKPCDVAGVRLAAAGRPELERKTGLLVGIFCAGTPASQGTVDLLRRSDIDPGRVQELRYRGRGWPGHFSVRLEGEADSRDIRTYADAWAFIQQYRPYRCHLCPDATGEQADISCGDPWHRRAEEGAPGLSLVLVRSERGRRLLEAARQAGYVRLERADPSALEASQPGMPTKRGAVWGRLLAMKAFGVPVPAFEGYSLFSNWRRIRFSEKVRSTLGTARRIVQRGYFRPSGKMRLP